MTDFGFAPGKTQQDGFLRDLFGARPSTTLISGSGITTIEDFINTLESSSSVPKPTGDLFIGTHGNASAYMQIRVDGQTGPDTSFEDLVNAVASGSVSLPNDINHDASGALTDMKIHIRGCRIGKAEPFVNKLKEAFGDESPVTAPKHFHGVHVRLAGRRRTLVGAFEFLGTDFSLIRKEPFANHKEATEGFDAAGLTFVDGTPVPIDKWRQWIPKNLATVKIPMSVDLGRSIGTLTRISLERRFRHSQPDFVFTISGLTSLPPPAEREKKLLEGLKQSPLFSDENGFPIHERLGHEDIESFVKNMKWKFSGKKEQGAATVTMVCVGHQHEYVVMVPITDPPSDPATGKLVYNFFPAAGSSGLPVINELDTDDDQLFFTA